MNKVFKMAKYAPFFIDLIGVFLLMATSVILCVLLRRILGARVSIAGYIIFSCVFLSNSIISKVYIYYIHNGIGIGYVVTGLALLLFMDAMEQKGVFLYESELYVDYSSLQYRCIAGITDLVDVHLKEKYFSPYGYSFIGEGNYPFIQWGFDAFDGTNREMIHFLELHGHSFYTVSDESVLEEARRIGNTMPKWPAEGSVSMQDGYVLINM